MQRSQGRPPAIDLQQQLSDVYNRPVTLVFDSAVEIGPAAGLLAAHALSPDAAFLVVECDYPLLAAEAVGQLIAAHVDASAPRLSPVTGFVNSDGFGERLSRSGDRGRWRC